MKQFDIYHLVIDCDIFFSNICIYTQEKHCMIYEKKIYYNEDVLYSALSMSRHKTIVYLFNDLKEL